MEGHAKKCVERYCELESRTNQQLYKVTTPCFDDHQFQEEEVGSLGELSQVCSQIVLKCLYLARIGGPHILWSANKLARAVTTWTRACDKRLAHLICYIHRTSEFRQYCHVGNTAQQCRLGLFQESDFAGDLEDSKSTSGGLFSCLEVTRLFQYAGCARNKYQSHTVQRNAGLRMDGFPALDLWDLVFEVFHSPQNRINKSKGQESQGNLSRNTMLHIENPNPTKHVNLDLNNVDNVSSNVRSSRFGAIINVCEDNEAVIKMIIKR